MPTKFPKENFGIIVNIYIRPVFSNVLYQNIVSNEYGSKCKFIMSLGKGSLSNTQKNRKTRNLQIFITNYNASITYKYKITTSTRHSRSKTHERLRTIPNQVDTFSLPNAPKTLSKKVRDRLLKSTTSRDRIRNASVTMSTSSDAETSRKGHPISLANRWPKPKDVYHNLKHIYHTVCTLNEYNRQH